MRNVSRTTEPTSITRNAARWARELELQIRTHGISGVPRKFFDRRYKKTDVRKRLAEMYGHRCCYCEAVISVVAFPHIEHRAPIARFPRKAFDWNNLHLACPKCNGAKRDRWKQSAPVLDAVLDVPIDGHITYEISVAGVRRWPITTRGETTIEHADLNREGLPEARVKVVCALLKTIGEIRSELDRDGETPNVRAVVDGLYSLTEGQFGSCVRWAIDKFLDIRVRR